MKVFSTGACKEVTGSHHFIEANGSLIEIDCGMFQGSEESDSKNREPEKNVNKIDAVLITHAHADHCALLPTLTKAGYKGPIYSTPATRDLASLIMLDSAKIQKNENQQLFHSKKRKTQEPIYSEEDAIAATNQFITVPYNKTITIRPNVDATFYDAGHILGSSMINVCVKPTGFAKLFKRPINILYTGDLGRSSKPIVSCPVTNMPAPDYLYLESTYGNRQHESLDKAMSKLINIIKATAAHGGKILIPSFALQRTQDLIYYLNILSRDKKIPRIPIYVDSPMATTATGIFKVHPECYNPEVFYDFTNRHKSPFVFSNLHYVSSMKESLDLDKSNDPMIIIAGNGMCNSGRIIQHVQAGIGNPKNTILFVGFVAKNTIGNKILSGDKQVKIANKNYNVKAQVNSINAFSAHADKGEIADWLASIDTSHLKKIFLVHGDSDAQEALSKFLKNKGFKNIEIVEKNTKYSL